jgi:VWFA-related protein
MTIFNSDLTRRGFALSAISAISAARLLRAQKDTTFSADVKVVNVFATVRDKQGKIVQNLTKDDFVLSEDGRPQVIKYFSQESNLPLTLGLLVDTSMSQRRVLGQERTASESFLQQVLREDKDQLLQDLTSSRKQLDAALAQLELPQEQRQRGGWGTPGGRGAGGQRGQHGGGGTSLYDSVLLASDELMKKQSGRKALIMLTDGVDNASKVSLSSAIESAQRADTLVYSILFADRDAYGGGGGGFGGGGMGRRGGGRYPPRRQEEHPDGKKILQRLSKETGGGFFEVSKKLTIEKIYDQIQEELRNQYSLGYTPDAGTGYRKILLTVKRNGLIVQTREGYYA